MRELLKIWWPGAKLAMAVGAVGLLWSGLGWCYAVVAGWLPPVLYQVIGCGLFVLFFPISLAIAVEQASKLGPKKER